MSLLAEAIAGHSLRIDSKHLLVSHQSQLILRIFISHLDHDELAILPCTARLTCFIWKMPCWAKFANTCRRQTNWERQAWVSLPIFDEQSRFTINVASSNEHCYWASLRSRPNHIIKIHCILENTDRTIVNHPTDDTFTENIVLNLVWVVES